jgi:diaminohydroxyphosphoribosylaminopyrimidine deaminase / 5-amino-6-(5-phosphoribosylamino)uracil reductase
MSRILDEQFMAQAIELARTQMGKTSPDPMVGAVLVKENKVISTGYHSKQSTSHAEAMAIDKAGIKAKGATLYLNLEPCCHYGFNPPCTHKVIKAGIKRVVAAIKDPNPLVSGKGFKELIDAGIEVDIGIMKKEAIELNEAFIKHIRTKIPFVILKSAMSLDGKIVTAGGESKYITNKLSRQHVHITRVYVDAIMTSVNTIKIDNPLLTVRDIGKENIKKRDPKKIVIDPKAETPLNSNILKTEPEKTIIVTSGAASASKLEKLRKTGAIVMKMPSKNGTIDLKALLVELGEDNIMSIMIEAGGNFAASALKAGIVDKVMYFIAPKILGGSEALTAVEGPGINKLKDAIELHDVTTKTFGGDILVEGYL